MKWVALILATLFVALQYRIWFGQTSFQKIQAQQAKVSHIKQENLELLTRNKKLLAEIKDLKQGSDAIEERARYQLGMIKDGEVFFRILNKEQ